MFSQELSSSQRRVVAALLSQVVHADGRLAESEESMVAVFTERLGVQLDTSANGSVAANWWDGFGSQRDARIAILDLVAAAYVDDEYSSSERVLIESIASALEVPVETLRRIEGLIELGRLWRKQCDNLLAE